MGDVEENAGVRGPAALEPTSRCFGTTVARMFSGPVFPKINVTCHVAGLWHPVLCSSRDISVGVVVEMGLIFKRVDSEEKKTIPPI